MGKKFIIRDFKPDDPLPPLFEPGGGARELMDPKNWVDDAAPAASNAPVEPENVTAPVTDPPRAKTPWEEASLTEQEWNDLEIPKFLRRDASTTTLTAPSTPTSTPSTRKSATAPAADASGGATSGASTSAPIQTPPVSVMPGATGNFEQFRVDTDEIESKIRHEADRRWRAWVPTKEHLSRPQLRYYLKQVRKEFYP
jgi:hypothetical protein